MVQLQWKNEQDENVKWQPRINFGSKLITKQLIPINDSDEFVF